MDGAKNTASEQSFGGAFSVTEVIEYLRLVKQVEDYLRTHPALESFAIKFLRSERTEALRSMVWDLHSLPEGKQRDPSEA